MSQLPLPFGPAVDIDDPRYARGFCAGFVARRDDQPPPGIDAVERAGWLDGKAGCQVPEHRWVRVSAPPL